MSQQMELKRVAKVKGAEIEAEVLVFSIFYIKVSYTTARSVSRDINTKVLIASFCHCGGVSDKT